MTKTFSLLLVGSMLCGGILALRADLSAGGATDASPPKASSRADEASSGTKSHRRESTDVADATTDTDVGGDAHPASAGGASAVNTSGKSGHHRRHAKTQTATTKAPANDSNASPVTAAEPPAAAPAENLAASIKTNVVDAPSPAADAPPVAKASRRKKHGKDAAHTPTIVVTPSAVPLPQQVPVVLAPGTTTLASVSPVGFGPTVQTGLPVARPGSGTTASLPTGVVPFVKLNTPTLIRNNTPLATSKFPFADYPLDVPRRRTQTYPWRTNIITTVFWIGEGGSSVSSTTNFSSAWNMEWIHDNGGADSESQEDMSGYGSSHHASTLNPFYIALPFNDLVYPDKARRWIPASWFKPAVHGHAVSACQNRWVEIKNRQGRFCFAQWEDVGPLRYDHAEYVFGNERPTNTLTRAGLDVSPAVAKYLGIDRTGITSWRFVDDDDVEPGMWLKYDEQAILFKALKESSHRSPAPIQDMAEPTPDDNGQDANAKRAGAARG